MGNSTGSRQRESVDEGSRGHEKDLELESEDFRSGTPPVGDVTPGLRGTGAAKLWPGPNSAG